MAIDVVHDQTGSHKRPFPIRNEQIVRTNRHLFSQVSKHGHATRKSTKSARLIPRRNERLPRPFKHEEERIKKLFAHISLHKLPLRNQPSDRNKSIGPTIEEGTVRHIFKIRHVTLLPSRSEAKQNVSREGLTASAAVGSIQNLWQASIHSATHDPASPATPACHVQPWWMSNPAAPIRPMM
jgi:hypothetical protein